MAASNLGAFVEYFDGLAIKELVNNKKGLWVGEVPSEFALPFVCLVHLGTMQEFTTEADYYEHCRVQFRIYEDGLDDAEALGRKLCDSFDLPEQSKASSLTVTSAKVMQVIRGQYKVDRETQLSDEGSSVFRITVDYTMTITRKLPGRHA